MEYGIISPDCNIMKNPECYIENLKYVSISYVYQNLDELIDFVKKFHWQNQYNYKSDLDFEWELKNKRYIDKQIYGNLYIKWIEDKTYKDEREHRDFKIEKEEYINQIYNTLKNLKDGERFFQTYNELGMNIDCDPLTIVRSNDFVKIDGTTYVPASEKEFREIFNHSYKKV